MKYIKLLSIVFLLPAVWSHAQETKKNLQECIDMAMQNNLTMQSGKIAVQRAVDLQGTAFNIDATNVSLSQDPTSGGSPDNSLSVTQRFDFPTVYASRRGLLKAETDMERSNLEVKRNELVRLVSSVYYRMLYAKENIRILQAQDSIYKKFMFLATAKFKSGESNRLEQMNAERLCSENKMELQKAEKDFINLQLLVQKLLNTDEQIEPQEDFLPVAEIIFATEAFDIYQTPTEKQFSDIQKISEKQLSIARQQFLPSFNISLRNQMLVKSYNPYDISRERFDKGNFMGFEVGVGLPLFFGERMAKTKAAKREVEMVHLQRENALQNLQNEYETQMNEYRRAKTEMDYYTNTGRQQAENFTILSQVSYEKGEIGYIEYIQNLKSALEIYRQYADAVNNYNQIVLTINYLHGNK
ncbi:MAG: TolC family protein [Bacteroidales bacterium]|jgi:cobalt-zinc-cadmium resistance protein CzcA|nr:TolC family protein [Bacteroidales bacterium]